MFEQIASSLHKVTYIQFHRESADNRLQSRKYSHFPLLFKAKLATVAMYLDDVFECPDTEFHTGSKQ